MFIAPPLLAAVARLSASGIPTHREGEPPTPKSRDLPAEIPGETDRPAGRAGALEVTGNEEQAAQAKAVFETIITDFRLMFTLIDPTHLDTKVKGTPVGGSVSTQAATSSIVLVKSDQHAYHGAMSAAPSHIRSATRGDLPEVAELLNACDVAEVGEPDTATEDVDIDWGMEGFELARDAWVAVGDEGVLEGYAYVGDQFRTGELEADLWVRPEHDEPELAPRLLNLAERRGRGLAAARGYEAPVLDIFCIGVNRAKRDLLLRHGYTLSRTVYRMAADLSDGVAGLPVPQGLAIRPFRVGLDEHVMHEAMNEAFADHFRHSEEPFSAWNARLLGHADFDADLWFLAWDGDEAAGALIAYDHGDLAWVKGLGVRRPWRRRGLGGALLAHAFAVLAARGQRRVELGVDAEGETQPLHTYEGAGMHVTFTYELYAKSLAG